MDSTASGSGGLTPTGRKKRRELTFAERIEVIMDRKSGKSMQQLADQFGCGKTQILNILAQRETYLNEWVEKNADSNPHISGRKRRSRRTGNEGINQLVWDWYKRKMRSNVRVTGPLIQREARSIAHSLGIENFAASNGWLDFFRRLHNIGRKNKVIRLKKKKLQRVDAATSSSPHPNQCYPDGRQYPQHQRQLQFHQPMSLPPGLELINSHNGHCNSVPAINDNQNTKNVQGCGPVDPRTSTGFLRHEWQQQFRPSVIIRVPKASGNNQSSTRHQPQRQSVLVSTAQVTFSISSDVSTSTISSEKTHEVYVDTFTLLRTATRERGLSSLEWMDEDGSNWLEIRPSPSSQYPFSGCRTHPVRLNIDRNCNYWLEALGQCVRSGTLRSLTTGSADLSLIQTLFSLLLLMGSSTDCQGGGRALKSEEGLSNLPKIRSTDGGLIPSFRQAPPVGLDSSKTDQTCCHAYQPFLPALEPIPPTDK